MKIKYTLEIDLNTKQNRNFFDAIKEHVENQVVGTEMGHHLGELQEAVMDRLGFDDDVSFEDVGIKMDAKWEHDYI